MPDPRSMLPGRIVERAGFRLRAAIAIVVLLAPAVAAAPAGARRHHHHHRHHHHRHHHRRHHHRRHHAHLARVCPNANTPVGSASRDAIKEAVVCLINKQRVARGLPALDESSRLDRSAQGWTNTMVGAGSFTHGADFAARISAVGFGWRAAGENIATGYLTPHGGVSGWMASAGHCENILNPAYTNVGTGVLHHVIGFGGNGATWTQDFALAISRHAPSGNWGPSRGCPY